MKGLWILALAFAQTACDSPSRGSDDEADGKARYEERTTTQFRALKFLLHTGKTECVRPDKAPAFLRMKQVLDDPRDPHGDCGMVAVPNELRGEAQTWTDLFNRPILDAKEPVLFVPDGRIVMVPWDEVPLALAMDGYRRPTTAELAEYDEKKRLGLPARVGTPPP